VFVDAVMANVVVFAVGQLFAWLFLRTGRFWLGAGATVALWGSIDWWLVGRYLLAAPATSQQLPLVLLQGTSIAITIAYLWALIRRRLAAPQRADRFRTGIALLLSGQLGAAETTFRKLAWSDPWDPSAWLARGDACRRLGHSGRARQCYRRASSVDVRGQFADLVAHRMKLLLVAAPLVTAASQKPAVTEVIAIAPPSGALASPGPRTGGKSVRKARS
jgi:tetratricopeptide (TPR) repeat protein